MKKGVILFVFIVFSISLTSAWADDGTLTQNVDGCNQMNTTNATYTFIQNVSTTGSCFTVTANNITIDMNEKTITGDANSLEDYGIYINNFDTNEGCIKHGTTFFR